MCGRTIERYNNRHLFLHVILFDALLFFCHKSEVEKVVLFDAPCQSNSHHQEGTLRNSHSRWITPVLRLCPHTQ